MHKGRIRNHHPMVELTIMAISIYTIYTFEFTGTFGGLGLTASQYRHDSQYLSNRPAYVSRPYPTVIILRQQQALFVLAAYVIQHHFIQLLLLQLSRPSQHFCLRPSLFADPY